MQLSIVIPVYNEKANIGNAIESIHKKVKTPHKILVVYDSEKDNTLPVVNSLKNKIKNIKLVRNNTGNGKGVINAIKSGFKNVKSGVVVVTMADLSDDPGSIDKMFSRIKEGFDVVCASRYSEGGKKIGGPPLKSFLSRMSGLLTPILLGIPTRDVTNAFKMYRKEVINSIDIKSRGGFELSMEIVIKAHFKGFKISEIPTVWHDRTDGQSRFKLIAWLPRYIYWYAWGIGKRIKNNV